VYPIDDIFYCAALRGKAGELIACSKLDGPNKDRLLPYFILPSRTAKENKALSGDAVIVEQVSRLWDHWGPRPSLVDLGFLKFDADAGSDAGWFNQLLAHTLMVGCPVIPVVGLETNYYRTAAAGAHAQYKERGVPACDICGFVPLATKAHDRDAAVQSRNSPERLPAGT
jgi:hypothetical protein